MTSQAVATEAPVVIPAADLDAQIGRRAHQLMWDRQMTQTTFAARIGMDQSSVAKRLRGKLGWSAAHLVQAATVLDTTVGYLVGEGDGGVGPAGIEPTTSTVELSRLIPFPTRKMTGGRAA